MKWISRMLFFSAIAIYLTSLWNKGFVISFDPISFLKTTIIIALFYYIITPLSKIILLPLNMVTFGLISIVVYFVLFHFLIQYIASVQIKEWLYPGFNVFGIHLPSFTLHYWQNVIISSISVSYIINLLEHII